MMYKYFTQLFFEFNFLQLGWLVDCLPLLTELFAGVAFESLPPVTAARLLITINI